jgi:hypothetical protein
MKDERDLSGLAVTLKRDFIMQVSMGVRHEVTAQQRLHFKSLYLWECYSQTIRTKKVVDQTFKKVQTFLRSCNPKKV